MERTEDSLAPKHEYLVEEVGGEVFVLYEYRDDMDTPFPVHLYTTTVYTRRELERLPRLREALRRWEEGVNDEDARRRAHEVEHLCAVHLIEVKDRIQAEGSYEQLMTLFKYDGLLPYQARSRALQILEERRSKGTMDRDTDVERWEHNVQEFMRERGVDREKAETLAGSMEDWLQSVTVGRGKS